MINRSANVDKYRESCIYRCVKFNIAKNDSFLALLVPRYLQRLTSNKTRKFVRIRYPADARNKLYPRLPIGLRNDHDIIVGKISCASSSIQHVFHCMFHIKQKFRFLDRRIQRDSIV